MCIRDSKQAAHTSFMYHHYPGPECASLYDMILRQLAMILDKMGAGDATMPEKGMNAKELYERFPISDMLDSPPGSPSCESPFRDFPQVHPDPCGEDGGEVKALPFNGHGGVSRLVVSSSGQLGPVIHIPREEGAVTAAEIKRRPQKQSSLIQRPGKLLFRDPTEEPEEEDETLQ